MQNLVRTAALAVLVTGAGLGAASANETASFVWEKVAGETVPADAFSAALEGTPPAYLCRVVNRIDLEIGHLGEAFCEIGGDGMNRPYSVHFVLTQAPGAAWSTSDGGKVPAAAVNFNMGRGPDSFACRFPHEGRTLIGNVHEGFCHTGYKDTELQSDAFDVLVWADGKAPAPAQ